MDSEEVRLKKSKAELIKAIQDRGSFYDSLAASDAIEFARKPDDPELKQRASRSVLLADACGKMANDIIKMIHVHW